MFCILTIIYNIKIMHKKREEDRKSRSSKLKLLCFELLLELSDV